MNLIKHIKNKYHFKYFTLIFSLLLYIPVIGLVITQFIAKNYFLHCFVIFIIMFIVAIILNIIYEKKYVLPPINNKEDLKNYIQYFSTSKISDLEYTESITWFSRLIHNSYLQTRDIDDDFTSIINTLHLILRPQNNTGLCIAINHKDAFIKLSKDLYKSFDSKTLISNIETLQNQTPQKYRFIHLTLDKNILIYLLFFPVHILGCFLLTKDSDNTFKTNVFIGNLLLYIPSDILILLIYIGVVKNTQDKP